MVRKYGRMLFPCFLFFFLFLAVSLYALIFKHIGICVGFKVEIFFSFPRSQLGLPSVTYGEPVSFPMSVD